MSMTVVGGKTIVLRQEFAKELGTKPLGPQINFDAAGQAQPWAVTAMTGTDSRRQWRNCHHL